jgi:hypothetical protein
MKPFDKEWNGGGKREGFQNLVVPPPVQIADPGIGNGSLSVTTEITDGDPCSIGMRKNLEAAKKAKVKLDEIMASTNAAALAQYSAETRKVMIENTRVVFLQIMQDMFAVLKKHPMTEECLKRFPAEAKEHSEIASEFGKAGAVINKLA